MMAKSHRFYAALPSIALWLPLILNAGISFGQAAIPEQKAAEQGPKKTSLATKAAEQRGAWLAIRSAPGKAVVGAKVTAGGKAIGLSDRKGLIFIPSTALLPRAAGKQITAQLVIAKQGFQTARKALKLTMVAKTDIKAQIVTLSAIPISLGARSAPPNAPGTKAARPLASAFPSSQNDTFLGLKAAGAKGKTANVTAKPGAASTPAIRIIPLPGADAPIATLPRIKIKANQPAPSLTIQLMLKKPRKTKKKAKNPPQAEADVFAGALGRLVYAPTGTKRSQRVSKVALCDLSLGRCQFPVGKGLRPRQLSISGAGIQTKSLPIRSAKPQTVKISVVASGSMSKSSQKTPRSTVSGYASRYQSLVPLATPKVMARDGQLSRSEVANLIRYGATIKPAGKGKKARKSADGEKPLSWRDVTLYSPGFVTMSGSGAAPTPKAFASKAYQPPKVGVITIGKVTDKTWQDIDNHWRKAGYLRWVSQLEIKKALAHEGRSMVAWLKGSKVARAQQAAQPEAPLVDFVVVIAEIQGQSDRYLAVLRHRSGKALAAKLYLASEPVATAVADMVAHVPLELAAIASKDGDVALNLPKSLYAMLVGPSPKDKPKQPLPTLRLITKEAPQPIRLEAVASYPRMTYFSPLSIVADEALAADPNLKPTRIRVGQQFQFSRTDLALKESDTQSISVTDAAGAALADALIWTKEGQFIASDSRGRLAHGLNSSPGALQGWFHPGFGAHGKAKVQQAGKRITLKAPKMVEVTTSPVPAKVMLAGSEMGISPLGIYPEAVAKVAKPRKPMPLALLPLAASAASSYRQIDAKILPASLVAQQHYPIKLSPDHKARTNGLIAAGKLKEAARYIATLPRNLRNSFDYRFIKGTLLAGQGNHKGCHAAFKKLAASAKKQKSPARHAASALNESVCLSRLIRKSPSVKNLRHALASLKAAEKRSKAAGDNRQLATLSFYGSHLKYLHWQATGQKSYLDDAVRGYRYYLTMTAPGNDGAADEQLTSFKIEAKKVIAMAER